MLMNSLKKIARPEKDLTKTGLTNKMCRRDLLFCLCPKPV